MENKLKIVVGTQSKGKLNWFKKLFEGLPFEFILPSDLGIEDEVEEIGNTAKENAIIKAETYARKTGLPCMSLDSGLLFIDYPDEHPIQVHSHVKSPQGVSLNPIQMKEYYEQLAHQYGGSLKAAWVDAYALSYQGKLWEIDNEAWARKDERLTILDHVVGEWNEEMPIECLSIRSNRKIEPSFFLNQIIAEFSQALGYALPRRVDVEEYNPKWKLMFEKEKMMLQEVLKDEVLEIHHIGSTSVRNLKAKPIIDILIVVSDIEKMDDFKESFEFQGYEYLGEFGIAKRRYLRKRKIVNGEWIDMFHLHIFDSHSQDEIHRHIAVSRYLNAFLLEVEAYGELKQKLALAYPYDIDAYCDGKDEFVKALEQRALKWMESK